MVPYLARPDGATVAELCEKFGITRGELMDDLATLQMCGVPDYSPADLMDYSIEGGRVRVLMADYFARPLNLTRQEALTLYVAGSALVRSGVFKKKGALDSALEKIGRMLSEETAGELAEVIGRVEVEMRSYEGTVREIVDQGLEKGMNLQLEYYSYSRDQMTSREVEPLSLICSAGYWYLLAWCLASGDFRLFRLDRIASVSLTEHKVEERLRDSFDVPRAVGEYSPGRKAHNVKLRFDGRKGRRMIEEWPAAKVTERADGSLTVELRTRNLAWLATYLLRFGDGVLIESPAELRKLTERKAAGLLEKYSG